MRQYPNDANRPRPNPVRRTDALQHQEISRRSARTGAPKSIVDVQTDRTTAGFILVCNTSRHSQVPAFSSDRYQVRILSAGTILLAAMTTHPAPVPEIRNCGAINHDVSRSNQSYHVASGRKSETERHCPAMTEFDSTPIPVISISQMSPGFMFSARPSVPIQIMSPGSRVR